MSTFGSHIPTQQKSSFTAEMYLFGPFENGYLASVGKHYDEERWEIATLHDSPHKDGLPTYPPVDMREIGFSNTVPSQHSVTEDLHVALVESADVSTVIDAIKALPAREEAEAV